MMGLFSILVLYLALPRSAMIHPFGNANIKKACYCTPHFFIGLNLVEFPLKLIIMKNARKIAIERARINICSMLLQGWNFKPCASLFGRDEKMLFKQHLCTAIIVSLPSAILSPDQHQSLIIATIIITMIIISISGMETWEWCERWDWPQGKRRW